MQFETPDFRRALAPVLRAAERGAADLDDVLATTARIHDGDPDSWVLEWLGTAGEAWAAARGEDPLRHLLRAATYYDAALELIEHSGEPERRLDIWRRQRACWDRAVNILAGQRIRIAYDGTSLPGYFFAAGPEPRPLVIMNNGAVGATSRMWALGGAAAADRGWHWMTFDGPGQQAALIEQGLLARPDWEAVLTPVIDAMVGRGDVAPERMAAIGVGQGGFWLPRALAHEHRLAAAVADPGIVDVSAPWMEPLTRRLRAQLHAGDRAGFDRDMRVALLFAPGIEASLRHHAAPYGLNGSYAQLYEALTAYRLTVEPAEVTTPLLITADEDRWPGQANELLERIAAPTALVPAGGEAQIFDWLAARLD